MADISSSTIKEKVFYLNDLFYSYIFDFGRLKDFYKYDYRSLEGFSEKTQKVLAGYDDGYRTDIPDMLLGLNKDLGCSEQTLSNISKLKSKDAVTVTAGQQPGLFTGPIYTIYKTMTAINLSQSLSRELGVDVIPVFWNASDDSLTKEALNTLVYDKKGGLKKVSLCTEADSYKRLSDILVKRNDMDSSIEQLFSETGDTDFSEGLSNIIHGSLAGNEEIFLSEFFSSLILKLFEKQGIVIIDPAIKGLKDLSKRLILKDIDRIKDIKENIDSAGKKLKETGFEPKLMKMENDLDFFFNEEGLRKKVQKKGDKFAIGENEYDYRTLLSLLDSEPEKISLNVILRPLFQDCCLPNIATVCGPGEVSYFAQLKDVYEIFGVDQSIIYPRFSATIIEKKVSKSLERQDIAPSDLSPDLKDNIKRALLDSTEVDIESLMTGLKKDIGSILTSAERDLESLYEDSKTPFDRINRNMDKEIEVLRKKVIASLKRKNVIVANDFKKIYENIFPEKELQERKINIFYFLNRYGMSLMDDIIEKIDIFDFCHRFLEV